MKRLIIKNLGPLAEADLTLSKINIIVGTQSSGKSCVLKSACYCTWVEKRIELTQQPNYFAEDDHFIKEFIRFHKLQGYIRDNTYIEYESDYMRFSYNHQNKEFNFNWKDGRWNFNRSKVTYIPAERNMVAVIQNWFDIKLDEDNIKSFMADWETARKATITNLDILNLGVAYHYDSSQANSDIVSVGNGVNLAIKDTSSGLQSLIPLFVHLNYLDKIQYTQDNSDSISKINENGELLRVIYEKLFQITGKTTSQQGVPQKNEDGKTTLSASITLSKIGSYTLLFKNEKEAKECNEIYKRYTENQYCNIFLEEPEENLFPPTQTRLVEWLLEMSQGDHGSNLFIATHSPYIVTSFVEKENIEMSLFFTYINESGFSFVKTASATDIQEIYDNGVDVFFNLENFIDE